jgi:UDP-N-acetylglucosamine--N-acetylmuramyl-(pentapeptide) pyrophosphoryl-undecaprenol N-acetylglucosamine transferase
MARRTILFQPTNHIGLGHISRLIAIALAVREADPDCRAPFVIEGHGHGLTEAHGLPSLSLPSRYELLETPNWRSFDLTERRLLALDLATSLLQTLAPDLIVFDCLPNPAMMNAALERRVPIAICLRRAKDMRVYFDPLLAIAAAVRLVLIAHDEGECEVPAALRPRTRFTGPIVRRPHLASRQASAQAATAGRPLIVITGGGGGYPRTVEFYNLALAAFARARQQRPNLDGLLITGPLFTDWWQLHLVDGLRCLPFDPHLAETLAEASLVICQAGYNTVAEISALRVPAICLPAERGVDDQFARARDTAAASPAFELCTDADAATLAQRMLHRLNAAELRSPPLQIAPGAARAAESLLAVLNSAAQGVSS